MATPIERIFAGMIFELSIIIIASLVLVLIFQKYRERKHELTLYLFIIFLNFVIAIFFSWLVKVLDLYSGIEYLVEGNPDPGTVESWFLLRISSFRFTFVFVAIALLFSYILRVKLFDHEYVQAEKIAVLSFFGFNVFFLLVFFEKGNLLLDLLAFLFIAILMFGVYFPFVMRSLQAYRSVTTPVHKRAFLSLTIMGVSFILILIFEFLDRMLIFLGFSSYSAFYFLGWAFALIGIVFAYLGYIRPKKEETNQKE